MSQLYNGTQDFSPKILHEASVALKCAAWELLMRPEQAMALRRFQESAREVADLGQERLKNLTDAQARERLKDTA